MRLSTRSFVFGYLKKYRALIIISFLMAFVTVVLTLVIPVLTGKAVDEIQGAGIVNWNEITPIIILIAVCAGASALFTYAMNLINNKVSYGVENEMRRDAFNAVSETGLNYTDTHAHGDIISRIITDADAVCDGLLMGASTLFTGIITIVGTLIFMFIVNPIIAAIVVCVTPLSLLVARFISKRSYEMFKRQSDDRGDVTSHISESITNRDIIRSYQLNKKRLDEYDEKAGRLKKHAKSAVFFSSLVNPSTRFVNSIVYASVGVFGAIAAIKGHISVGMLAAFLGYANQYNKPFNEISGVITELQNARACAKRLCEIATEMPETVHDSDKILTETDGSVSIENVYFSYDADEGSDPDSMLIRDFNISVKPGDRVAIVGPTGAGKTTIINLIMRFYDVNSGRIKIGDTDIKSVTRDSLRERFGMVLQDSWIMNGSIRENIAYGRPDASDDEIIVAAKAAHIHSFIKRLPNGYDTIVSDTYGMSAGQRQLLSIARVMLTDPEVLILDEATSSIDTRTEARIQDGFAQMMKGRTTFIVAHRLSTIKNADIILVMKNGSVIEQGSHGELLAKNGFYTELYNASLG